MQAWQTTMMATPTDILTPVFLQPCSLRRLLWSVFGIDMPNID